MPPLGQETGGWQRANDNREGCKRLKEKTDNTGKPERIGSKAKLTLYHFWYILGL